MKYGLFRQGFVIGLLIVVISFNPSIVSYGKDFDNIEINDYWYEKDKILASDGAVDDHFGFSVSPECSSNNRRRVSEHGPPAHRYPEFLFSWRKASAEGSGRSQLERQETAGFFPPEKMARGSCPTQCQIRR